MIQYNTQNKTFYLETEKTSYVMRVLENGYLYHCYYGQKIAQDDMTYHNLFKDLDYASVFKVEGKIASLDSLPQECATRGRGDYRAPALRIENEFGQSVNELTYKTHTITKGKPKFLEMPQLDASGDECDTLEVVMEDTVGGFEVSLFYSVFTKENVIARRSVIRNCSDKTLKIVNAASICLDIEAKDFEMISLEGAWGRERHIERLPLRHGTTSVESRRGTSSHQLNPFAALVAKNTDEDYGEVYATSLIYSADFKISFEKDHYGNTRLLAGLNPETFSWQLHAGESFVTPEALLIYSKEGLGGMSRAFHEVCRNYLGKSADKSIKHPIVINNWEAMYFDITEEKLFKFISDCKGLGIDTMVLDDGWFGHRTNDDSSLGDWYVNPERFPEGLHNVIRCCKEHGMNFGIWFEPEMISRDSKLFEEHPDWCIHVEGYDMVEGRQQLVLDMTEAVYPEKPVVPFIKATQDRVVLEIQRGCIRGCRFCQAGMVYRPVREKHVERLKALAMAMLKSTGHEEISLSSLSSSDYSQLEELIDFLIEECNKKRVNISLPSLRIDAFSLDVMSKVQDVKKSSLTFAPEAGSQRLRDVINKGLTEEVILNGATQAFEGGWNKVKFYFMLGLPTETEEDMRAIAELANETAVRYYETVPKEKRNGKCQITISTSFFVPKPFTPFQWARMYPPEDYIGRAKIVNDAVKEQLNRKSIKYNWHEADVTVLEGVLARGDRRVGKAILEVYKNGGIFDAWSEFFDYKRWLDAFAACGIDPDFYTMRERSLDELFPWDFIDTGVSKEFLQREWKNAMAESVTPNCRMRCSGCGVKKFGGGVCYEN